MRLSKVKLEAALKSLAAAHCKANAARAKIYAHAETVYGVTPSEIDNDTFIDACDAGCGNSSGMTADEFDLSMRECMELRGIEAPDVR